MDNVLMLLLVFVVLVVVAYSWGATEGASELTIPSQNVIPEIPVMYQLGDDFQFSEDLDMNTPDIDGNLEQNTSVEPPMPPVEKEKENEKME